MAADLTEISNQHLRLSVRALGAETQSICDSTGQEFLWQGAPQFWTGRAPILFPIVGAAPGNRIAYDGVECDMPRHGFARHSRFELQEHLANSCTHQLVASPETRAAFPFEFSLRVTHRIDGKTVTVSAEVENTGAEAMAFGFGFHPAFVWPLPGAAAQAHRIVLDNGASPDLARISAEGLLCAARHASPFVGGALALQPNLFEQDAMIFPDGAGEGLCFAAEAGPSLRFAFENLPNLALWTKPGASFVCIEPWHGMAAHEGAGPEMADRPATCHLAAGHRERFAFSVTFDGDI